MPVAEWGREDVEELLAYVERVGEEGLDPADYQPERLRAALAGADEIELGRAATDVFLRLSSDLSLGHARGDRSEEHTSELQSLMRTSYAVFCLKTKKKNTKTNIQQYTP